jgi:transcriptional regulator with XRE-family HTH domain
MAFSRGEKPACPSTLAWGILTGRDPVQSERGSVAVLDVLMPLKDQLRKLRIAAGLTQQALAVKAGLSISNVIHIEAGRIPDPRVSTVKALADALGCMLDDLMADQPPREPRPRGPRDGKGKRKRGKGSAGPTESEGRQEGDP